MKQQNSTSTQDTNWEELDQYKEDFICATSHELKTPLTSQKAFIHILDQMITQNNDQHYKKYINKIADQNAKLSQLVNSLLDASKIKGGRLKTIPSTFDITELVEEIITDLNQTYKHSIILKSDMQQSITTDKAKLDQVITNLIQNAVKYSPATSEIIVSIENNKNTVIVSVKDYGIGIDPEYFDHIFEPFYRIHGHKERTFPGLGMGLFISNEIIKHLGGKMWVESKKNLETTFFFSIPTT